MANCEPRLIMHSWCLVSRAFDVLHVGTRVGMLEMGASKPWPDALEALTGQRQMDAGAMAEYFAPLKTWLDQQNKGKTVGW